MPTPSPDLPPTLTRPPELPATLPAVPGEGPTAPPQLGDFELAEELARGGMGIVYKARQLSLNRWVALKMVLAGRFADGAAAQRFKLEAEAAAALDHPHIVPIYEIGSAAGQTYFTMKLIEGETLAAKLKATPLEARQGETLRGLIQMLRQVAEAVEFAHRRGVIHRDLKPANILLEGGKTPYVADFGLAKLQAEGPGEPGASATGGLTHTGAVLGTPNYMAPEQARGGKETTTQTDVYGLGAILYEILTGGPPHRGMSQIEVLLKVQQEEPAAPSVRNPAVDKELAAICLKCLKKVQGERYGSAGALAEDLGHWLAGEPISVRPPGLLAVVRNWLAKNLRDAFWVNAVGIVGGGGGLFLASAPAMLPMFSNGARGLAAFPSYPAPPWFSTVAYLAAALGSETSTLLGLLGMTLLGGLGYLLSLFVDLREPRRALSCGVGLGLVAGLAAAFVIAPATLIAFVVVPELGTNLEVSEKYFSDATVPAGAKAASQLPTLPEQFPDLQSIPAKDRAWKYFAFSTNRLFIGIFEGVWFGLALSFLVFPVVAAAQAMLAGYLWRHVAHHGMRVFLYVLLVMPAAYCLLLTAEFGWVVANNLFRRAWNFEHLVEFAFLLLAYAAMAGLIFAVRRRQPATHYVFLVGGWFCASACLLRAAAPRFNDISMPVGVPRVFPYLIEAQVYGALAVACLLILLKQWRRSPPQPTPPAG